MYLAENLWTVLIKHLRVLQLTSTFPLFYNKKLNKICVSPYKYLLVFKIKLIIALLFALSLFIQVVIYGEQYSVVLVAQSIFFALNFGSHAIIGVLILQYSKDMSTVINWMVQLERQENSKNLCFFIK